MKLLATLAVAAYVLVASAGARADETGVSPAPGAASSAPGEEGGTLRATRVGSQPSARGPTGYFTGSVRIDPLFPANAPSRTSGGSITFEPGARTAWHTHPLGQTSIVTAGFGWVQRWDGPVEEMRMIAPAKEGRGTT